MTITFLSGWFSNLATEYKSTIRQCYTRYTWHKLLLIKIAEVIIQSTIALNVFDLRRNNMLSTLQEFSQNKITFQILGFHTIFWRNTTLIWHGIDIVQHKSLEWSLPKHIFFKKGSKSVLDHRLIHYAKNILSLSSPCTHFNLRKYARTKKDWTCKGFSKFLTRL